VPLEGGRPDQTRRAVITEAAILAALTEQRSAALGRIAAAIATDAPTASGPEDPAPTTEATVPAAPPSVTPTVAAAAARAIIRFPVTRAPWPRLVPGPPDIPAGLQDRPAAGNRPAQSRSAARVRWLQGQSRSLARINLTGEARRISQRGLASDLEPLWEDLGDLRLGDVASYARGDRRGTRAVWGEDLNGWIRLALSREPAGGGRSLDDAISAGVAAEGGYALSRLEYRRVVSDHLDAHPTATEHEIVMSAARQNAGSADYFHRIWPPFQRLRAARAARAPAASGTP
jgi:hypothetical protein